jgi:hypothetical protein
MFHSRGSQKQLSNKLILDRLIEIDYNNLNLPKGVVLADHKQEEEHRLVISQVQFMLVQNHQKVDLSLKLLNKSNLLYSQNYHNQAQEIFNKLLKYRISIMLI